MGKLQGGCRSAAGEKRMKEDFPTPSAGGRGGKKLGNEKKTRKRASRHTPLERGTGILGGWEPWGKKGKMEGF